MPIWPFSSRPPRPHVRDWLDDLEESLIERAWEWTAVSPRQEGVVEWVSVITNTVSKSEIFWNDEGDYFFAGDVVGRHRPYNSRDMRDYDRFRATVRRHLALKAKAVLRHDFAATARILAEAVLAGDLTSARILADYVHDHGVRLPEGPTQPGGEAEADPPPDGEQP